MAKKTTNWETVANDKEVLSRVETLVKEGAAMSGDITQEMCDELNALTGNGWKSSKYKEICDTEVNIPSKINGKKVKAIGSFA